MPSGGAARPLRQKSGVCRLQPAFPDSSTPPAVDHAPKTGALQRMIASLEAMSLHQPAAEPFDWGLEYAWQVGRAVRWRGLLWWSVGAAAAMGDRARGAPSAFQDPLGYQQRGCISRCCTCTCSCTCTCTCTSRCLPCSPQDQLYGLEGRPLTASPSRLHQPEQQQAPEGGAAGADGGDTGGAEEEAHFGPQWVYLKSDQPLTAPAVSGAHEGSAQSAVIR